MSHKIDHYIGIHFYEYCPSIQINIEIMYTVYEELIFKVWHKLFFIGCEEHEINLTRKIIDFYLLTRGRKYVKAYNKQRSDIEKKAKDLRKKSKLNVGFRPDSDPNDWSEDFPKKENVPFNVH